jgi:hypothetical protein
MNVKKNAFRTGLKVMAEINVSSHAPEISPRPFIHLFLPKPTTLAKRF